MTGGGESGKDLQAEGLDLVARGLTDALGELKELGMVGAAGAGRGFSDIGLSGLELGHEGVTERFKSFCERWEWGVRSLIHEGNEFAKGVGLSAGTYYETDQYVQGSFKVGVNSLMGNPYATEEEVTQKDWGQVFSENPISMWQNRDYSGESWSEANANVTQGLKDTGRDLMTSKGLTSLGISPNNLHGAAGISDGEYDQWLDNTFGPSPEERAETAEQQGGQAGGDQ
ncbi:hypothetical protein OKJ48_28030 [Streptomyces kunmingensis]|uniref:Uncharacterized protein n=1 Tax=Streptomyces kunmingensis TaxID=68225 RepID=A0ABU6CH61_9ACTN|nr:hypothetical protein [Streptomyces kunmingensis]MEB3964059.1 hypothetical protein [Streptomyces kunmingensis]